MEINTENESVECVDAWLEFKWLARSTVRGRHHRDRPNIPVMVW